LNGHCPPKAVSTQANTHTELRQLSLLKEVSAEKRREWFDQMAQFRLRRVAKGLTGAQAAHKQQHQSNTRN
jgi:hypothetical protein